MATNDDADADADAMTEIVVRYRECQRNHAAQVLRYAVDGGDFLPAEEAPEALICGACGCHRSFHRREELELPVPIRGPPRFRFSRRPALPPLLPPPPPLLPALAQPELAVEPPPPPEEQQIMEEEAVGRKKVVARTVLSAAQKNQLVALAEKLGWRTARHDEEDIRHFCLDIGISYQTFKNWINNNRRRMESGQPSSTKKKN